MEKKTKTKQTQKCKTWYTLCEHDFSNNNTIQTVIPAVTKSAGFAGVLPRFAKSRLLHPKQ